MNNSALILLLLISALFLAPRAALAQRQDWVPSCCCSEPAAVEKIRQGVAAHRLRRLDDASAAYAEALSVSPPRQPSAAEREVMMRFAPRISVTPNEPFRLMDVVAVMHPDKPWVAYHFFWEDDIDFPDDNDPCDHELMWVRLDSTHRRIEAYYTYFHGRILKAPAEDVADAVRHNGRPAVVVQWGKHGTMPRSWRTLPIVADTGDSERAHMRLEAPISLEEYNRGTYEKLSKEGRQFQESPLARGWPLRFPGGWTDFANFSRRVEPLDLLKRNGMLSVSCLNNAVIDRHFLRYNFSAKTEWPAAMCE